MSRLVTDLLLQDDSKATLNHVPFNSDNFTISYSYYFTGSSDNGLPCNVTETPSQPTSTSTEVCTKIARFICVLTPS